MRLLKCSGSCFACVWRIREARQLHGSLACEAGIFMGWLLIWMSLDVSGAAMGNMLGGERPAELQAERRPNRMGTSFLSECTHAQPSYPADRTMDTPRGPRDQCHGAEKTKVMGQ